MTRWPVTSPQPAHVRVLKRVSTRNPVQCWLWEGARNPNGYGVVQSGGKGSGMAYVHRVIYEALVDAIAADQQVDHICHTQAVARGECVGGRDCLHRICVNPAHLEAVTQQENLLRGNTLPGANARKTRCPQRHLYDEGNTYLYKGNRQCRTCRRERKRGGGPNSVLREPVERPGG